MNVLVVTRSDDNDCVAWAMKELRRRGHRAVRLDTDTYPQELDVETELRTSTTRRRTAKGFDLEMLDAIWYRRFLAGGRLPDELGDTREACVDESRRTLYGTIAACRCFQLDPLWAVRRTDHKELQLRQARAFGLEIPATLFTNSPAAVRRFVKSLGKTPVVTKMQSSFSIYRQGREQVVYTTVLTPKHLADLDGLRACPMTFQAQVPKRLELRATVVGKRVFTAAVDSQALAGARVDWRKEGVALLDAWRPYTLPAKVERALLRLTRWFGLNYAAADFIVTPDGRHVFLEINAGGEFFWLQRQPGLPIVEALCDVLTTPRLRAVDGVA